MMGQYLDNTWGLPGDCLGLHMKDRPGLTYILGPVWVTLGLDWGHLTPRDVLTHSKRLHNPDTGCPGTQYKGVGMVSLCVWPFLEYLVLKPNK